MLSECFHNKYFKTTADLLAIEYDNLFTKYIAYCRHTGTTPVTCLLLKSE